MISASQVVDDIVTVFKMVSTEKLDVVHFRGRIDGPKYPIHGAIRSKVIKISKVYTSIRQWTLCSAIPLSKKRQERKRAAEEAARKVGIQVPVVSQRFSESRESSSPATRREVNVTLPVQR